MLATYSMAEPLEASPIAGRDSGIPLIKLQDVVKIYKSNSNEFMALKGIHASFYRGEYVGIIGKSGAGKTTLVNMMSGVDQITTGQVIVDDTSIHNLNESKLALWRGNNMGVVFQFFQLLPMLNLLDNIMLPMDFCHQYHPRKSFERAMYLLELVELEDHAYKLPSAISGGQQQRVAIARALANDPPIIVADEPTGSLDSSTAETVYQVFDELVRQEKTIIIVSHDPSLIQRVNRTVFIADGELIDEDITKIFPHLSHQQMLQISHQLICRDFTPGDIIVAQNTPAEYFSIVTGGQIELSVKGSGSGTKQIDTLHPGDFFGDVELVNGRKTMYTAESCASNPASIKMIEGNIFLRLLQSSTATNDRFAHIVQKKLARYSAAAGDKNN